MIFANYMEFRSFGQNVEVLKPDPELVDEVVLPTATAAPLPTVTAASQPTSNPTIPPGPPTEATVVPTPNHPPFPTPVPPMSHEEFQPEIDAADPEDVFEVLPGMFVVYEPCGEELDGVVTARLFDLSETQSRGYMALIHIRLSEGAASVEFPGLTTGAGIILETDNLALMDEIVEHADPVTRCSGR